ncbi:fructokinase [Cyanobium sp. NIES-981]|uniref:fructokinase n=1 Tax=Cyanobium sp. NIES-981 TaxID=1851505 RepID=UPI0007DE0E1D|nr:fructokinase [Cyanobium sp. NIES-981]SBO43246.1 putative fructokinase [Cyanobium sp. NIES-981]
MPFSSTDTGQPGLKDRASGVVDFAEAFRRSDDASTAATPASLTERLLPEVSGTFWLRVSSQALADTTRSQVLQMVLQRALPAGVSVALDVDWQPPRWGLPENAPPTAEVMRRFRPLAQSAQLIRCTADEAECFFSSDDPSTMHRQMAQKPAVLVRQRDGALAWCIGGRQGRIAPELLQGESGFLAHLLENLCAHPALLGNAGPGIDAIADPDQLAEQLLAAAAAAQP